MVEGLSSMYEALGSIPGNAKKIKFINDKVFLF
jgi:hypothetical protein